jgi:hypothetical protein
MRALWPLIFCVVMQTAVYAQQPEAQPRRPFIEPAELHTSTMLKAMEEEHPDLHGKWDILPFDMPINPVHAALMHNGKVLIIAGSGNDEKNKNFQAAVWDPRDFTIRTFTISWDMFCNGMVVLPDGRPFVLGGTLQYDTNGLPFLGEPRTSAFDPSSEKFEDLPNMSGGRWYPTGTVLGDGSVLVYSGLDNDPSGWFTNLTVQIWTGASFIDAGTAFPRVPLYPREHLLPNGKVFESGSNRDSQIYDPTAHRFTTVTTTNLEHGREYGTSVLLPLTPANGFKPKVMILGGGNNRIQGNPGTDTTELIDLSVPSPKWIWGPSMAKPRVQLNATLLPNGKILVSGGSEIDEVGSTAVKEAQLYDPETNTFASGSWMEFPRLYHSNTLLLQDGTVAAFGGNPKRRVYQPEIEIYSPPYLFNAGGKTLAKRPAITSVPTAAIGYG